MTARILIIEDDEQFARILLDFVREKGYKGILANQGSAGLSLARNYRPDAIILDMKLPVMDGSQVLKHLKNDPTLRHIPVQVVSGYDRRKEGFGVDLMKRSIESMYDLWGKASIRIGAQLYLKRFYEGFGFTQSSDMYLEDGIPHIEMLLATD